MNKVRTYVMMRVSSANEYCLGKLREWMKME